MQRESIVLFSSFNQVASISALDNIFLSHHKYFSLSLYRRLSAMDERQPSKKRQLAATTLSYKDNMEKELNKTLRPKHGSGSHVQPAPLTTPFLEPALIPTQSAPPSEEVATPVKGAPTTEPSFDGPSTSDPRGVYPEGYEHEERYGGRLTTRYNSSAVDDEEAAARVEWLYQSQRQALRMATYGGSYNHPLPSARGSGLRASFDGRERESQSFPALDCIRGIMERMERHLAGSFSAPVASPVHHHALPVSFTLFIII
jgi:SOS response regulatory protein OraA/RecX